MPTASEDRSTPHLTTPGPDNMAIFRTGPLIGGISGSIGGVTFVNARGSKVVRFRPPKRKTEQQFRIAGTPGARAALAITVKAWGNLSDANRINWQAAARDFNFTNRLGQSSALSGLQFFIKVNYPSALAGLIISDNGYLPNAPEPISSITAGADILTGYNVITQYVAHVSGTPAFFFGSLNYRDTTDTFVNDWKFFLRVRPPDVTALNITTDWELAFGPLRVDQTVKLKVQFTPSTSLPASTHFLTSVVTP